MTFKEKIQDRYNEIVEKPIMVTAIVLGFLGVVVMGVSLPFYISNPEEIFLNVLAEAHGMLFDVFVIGILLYWLREKGEVRLRIRQYQDEIDDFRIWESEEAAFRNVGNIKRLNRHKVYTLNLVGCYMAKTNIGKVKLNNSNLNNANLSSTILIEADLSDCRLNQTLLENANLNHANLKGAYASGAIFKDAFLIKSNFENAFLIKTDFRNAFLMEANLRGSALAEANFEQANLYKTDFRGAEGLTVEQLSKAKALYLAKFDPEIKAELLEKIPDLMGG